MDSSNYLWIQYKAHFSQVSKVVMIIKWYNQGVQYMATLIFYFSSLEISAFDKNFLIYFDLSIFKCYAFPPFLSSIFKFDFDFLGSKYLQCLSEMLYSCTLFWMKNSLKFIHQILTLMYYYLLLDEVWNFQSILSGQSSIVLLVMLWSCKSLRVVS